MHDSRPPRVLVVDDDGPVRALLCDLLALWGCEADAAATGSEGLQLFAARRYDLIVTDHSMPGLTGLELVRTVRHVDPTVAIIMVTAAAGELLADHQRLDFALVAKPFQCDALETAVRGALRTPGRSPRQYA